MNKAIYLHTFSLLHFSSGFIHLPFILPAAGARIDAVATCLVNPRRSTTTYNMADALCGPSNPLQQFKQQTQLDRSLQQDRLASRQHPTQGFRSPDLHAGLLDPAFEAFQAGLEPPALDYAPPFQHPTDFQNASPTPAWAADFQRLNISSPPAISRPQQQYTPASSTANWAQGFREHLAQAAPKQQISSYSPSSFQQRARYGLSGFQSSFAQHTNAPSFQAKGKEPAVERFDEAAFERAFDQARDDMMADAGRQDETSVETTLNHAEETVIQGMSDDDFVREEFMKVFAKERETTTTLNEEQKKEQDQRAEDDALAATAKELLEKVEHNHSEKFRNSQFLGLMRKLRDREVRVEGDKMVETVSATHHPHKPGLDRAFIRPSPTSGFIACKVAGCDILDHQFDHWESPVN